MADDFDLYEFPKEHVGRKTYVTVRGHSRSIPNLYTYRGYDGHNWVHPDFGGSWDGVALGEVAATVVRDIGAYTSVVDGSVITSRSQHREHLRQHGLVELGNERPKESKPNIRPDRAEIATSIKRHLDQVRSMPTREYRNMISGQQERYGGE
jgi:hypothetical protein